MTTPAREFHEYFFRVPGNADVACGDVTITPRDLTVQFLAEDGVYTTRVVVSGPDRNPDGTLDPHGGHSLQPAREHWPSWVADTVAGCTPEGWGT